MYTAEVNPEQPMVILSVVMEKQAGKGEVNTAEQSIDTEFIGWGQLSEDPEVTWYRVIGTQSVGSGTEETGGRTVDRYERYSRPAWVRFGEYSG